MTKPNETDVKWAIYERLSNKRWRITSGVIYRIKDKNGRSIPFIPNEFQLYYLKNKHNRNIILKARQMGFSTVVQLDYLDDALFNRNMNIGIIAQDLPTAQLIRKDKIEFALENLPEDIKGVWEYDKSNSKEIMLSNGSSIYVSNTFRGGTLQRLHVSEYANICAKRADKAKEIKTGALEAVAMDQQITIESTAEGNEWDFFEKCEEYSKMVGRPITPLDYKFFFFPWWLDDNYSYEGIEVTGTQDDYRYFEKLEKEHRVILSEKQRNWYILKKREKKEDMYKEYPSLYREAFLLAMEWAYYESEINLAYTQWRVTKVGYDPNLLVYTAWDIGGANPSGGGDDTSIWFYQIYGNEVRFIDHREWSGYSLLHILEHIIKQKPYIYGKHIGPHDMNVHEYTTGVTRLQTARQLGYEFELVTSPKWAIANRIETTRQLFSRYRFDEKNCGVGLTKLKKYRRRRDERNGVFQNQPEHNGTSHVADSIGYASQRTSEQFGGQGRERERSVIKMDRKL